MPLIRKPSGPGAVPSPAPVKPEAPLTLERLTAGTPDQRWAAVRAAAERSDSLPLLTAALAAESDARVREAIFTGLARLATTESAAVVVPYIRSDDASLRTAAIDALKTMPQACIDLLPSLLADSDPDVRLLSCELARGLPGAEASRLLCALIDVETEANVCAAAVEVLSETGDRAALPSLARCAERFAADPFLAFSIKAATDRIDSP